MMSSSAVFDILTADGKVMQRLLRNGSLRSADLVAAYKAQIDKHDGYLHAMLSWPSLASLIDAAKVLDRESKKGNCVFHCMGFRSFSR